VVGFGGPGHMARSCGIASSHGLGELGGAGGCPSSERPMGVHQGRSGERAADIHGCAGRLGYAASAGRGHTQNQSTMEGRGRGDEVLLRS
jgi:hypothetical protein